MADESTADIGLMVGVMAEAIAVRNNLMTGLEAWQLAGRILCPIFDYAKPDSYISEMTAVRESYAGIARDASLRSDFEAAVGELLAAGSLDDINQAVADHAWEALQRRRPVETY